MLAPKPLEITDFSGGITDNYVQGDPRRYQKADNFFITVDKHLEERWGILPFSENGFRLPGLIPPQNRINGMYSFQNGKYLMVQSGRSVFYEFEPLHNWREIVGVDGQSALEGGSLYAQTTYAEFQKQVYFTSNDQGNGTRPSKIYRDENNEWVSRTAGLPRAWVGGNYTEQSLLGKAIALALDLRSSFISHFTNAFNATYAPSTPGFGVTGNLHINVDKYSLSYLQSVSFSPGTDPEIPSPIPTPATTATNLNTLCDLVYALTLAYIHHTKDSIRGNYTPLIAANSTNQPYYHQSLYYNQIPTIASQTVNKGPVAFLNQELRPTTLEQAAACLDDLLQKWNWHRKAVNTHSPDNDPSQFDIYAPTQSKIGKIHMGKTFPTITPDFGDIYAYVNNLKFLYNSHITSQNWHKQRDNSLYDYSLENRLPDATNIDDAYLQIFWTRALYSSHYTDSSVPSFVPISFTCAAGSAGLTSVIRTDTGGAYTIPIGSVLYFAGIGSMFAPTVNTEGAGGFYATAKVLSSGLGTATLDRVSAITGSTQPGEVSLSKYHVAWTWLNNTAVTAPLTQGTDSLAIQPDEIGSDTQTWMTLASDLFDALQSHALNGALHSLRGNFYSGNWNLLLSGFYEYIRTVPYPNFFKPSVAQTSYAFYFSYPYQVETGGLEYETLGNPIFSDSAESAISYPVGYINSDQTGYPTVPPIVTTRGNLLTNLPVLTNSNGTAYDLAKVRLNIYRTTDGGTTYYKVTDVANGTTSYLDIKNDTISTSENTALNLSGELYTTGGVVGYDQPPVSKFIHAFGRQVYYGGITDTGQEFPNRLLQSVPNAPDAAPASFYYDLDDDLAGISSTKSNLIALCESSIYRMSGGFDVLGRGSITADKIQDAMGCISAKSIVKTDLGLFYAGTDGFYYTDGYQCIKISLELDKTYASLVKSSEQRSRIYGGYDKATRRVYWAMQEAPTAAENSVFFVYYLNFGVKPSGVFTKIRNGTNLQPASFVFRDGTIYIGDGRGAILKSDPWNKYDAEVDVDAGSVQDWNYLYIPYWFRSMAVDMGTVFNRKWTTKLHLIGKNQGNMFMQPSALRDLNETQQYLVPMAPINYNVNLIWGDARCVWGDENVKWEYDGKMDLYRRFPAKTLRSDMMQVDIQPANKCVYSYSQNYPEFAFAEVSHFAGNIYQAVLSIPTGYTEMLWPADINRMYISFPWDDYTERYLISMPPGQFQDRTTLYIEDLNGTMLEGSFEWEIWGVKIEQRVSIDSLVISFAYLGEENQAYPGAKTGDGPGNGGENP